MAEKVFPCFMLSTAKVWKVFGFVSSELIHNSADLMASANYPSSQFISIFISRAVLFRGGSRSRHFIISLSASLL